MPSTREQKADCIRETLSCVYSYLKERNAPDGSPDVMDMERRIMEAFPRTNGNTVHAHLFAIRMHLEALSVHMDNG